ncbi:MAG: D-aminoacylase [Gemmataceae bacterium]|nr:D-aminoacylase [Gemmataceae bacterium]
MFDLLFKNGRVVDGSGQPWFSADVALLGDRIVDVGKFPGIKARKEIDCSGQVVAPGLVDTHVHGDLVPFLDPMHEPAIRQGITTYIVGQDGVAMAPGKRATIESMCQYTAGFSMGKVFLDKGMSPFWTSIGEYLAAVKGKCALNIATLIPNGNVRMEVLGHENRSATPVEMQRMQELIREGMEEGAVGLSTGLDYIPSRFADTQELIQVCQAVAPYGGIYVTHMRRYDPEGLAVSMAEVFQIGREAGLGTHISHFNSAANLALPLLDQERAAGGDCTFDLYCYLAGSTILGMIALPAEIQQGGREATLQRLADAVERQKLAAWFESPRVLLGNVSLTYLAHPEWTRFEGLSLPVAALQYAGGEGPKEIGRFVCDALVACQLAVGCIAPHRNRDESDIAGFMTHPAMMGGSDGIYTGGSPHPRGRGCFARYLGHYVRQGVWTLETAISRLSYHGARRHGLRDRGLLLKGMAADVIVFDQEKIQDQAWFGSGAQLAAGMKHVYVNGQAVLENGVRTATLPGRGLKRGS